jgi:hypothetical protein
MTKPRAEASWRLAIRHWCFAIHSSFGFRASSFPVLACVTSLYFTMFMLGKNFCSFSMPASVTFVPRSSRHLNPVRPARCALPRLNPCRAESAAGQDRLRAARRGSPQDIHPFGPRWKTEILDPSIVANPPPFRRFAFGASLEGGLSKNFPLSRTAGRAYDTRVVKAGSASPWGDEKPISK